MPQLAKVLERLGQLEERVEVLEAENKALRAENAALKKENWKKALDWGGEEENSPSWFRGLVPDYEQLFVWMKNERVPLTNNLAERDLRGLVIVRKTSFGTESESEKQFIQRLYSVAQTLKRRGDDVLDFMRRSLAAHRSALPAPALLPP